MASSQPPPPPSDPKRRSTPVKRKRAAGSAPPSPPAKKVDDQWNAAAIIGQLKAETKKHGAGVLASVGLHITMLIILGVLVMTGAADARKAKPTKVVSSVITDADLAALKRAAESTFEAVKIDSPPPPAATVPETTPPPVTTSPQQGTAPSTAPPADEGAKPGAGSSISPTQVSVGGVLGGRGQGGRAGRVKAAGGSDRTEQAVSAGLSWLARQQQPGGNWELHKGYPNPGEESLRTDTGATALALLAFLGAGQTHQQGTYKAQVSKGINWLRKTQKPNGDFHDWDELGRQTAFYAHGQATIVLCEAYALTHDSSLLTPAQNALSFLFQSQHPVTGGWKYRPGSEGDLSVFGWQVMALQSARMAGIEVPDEALFRAEKFLDLVQEQYGARYKYEPTSPRSRVTPAMTAEGLLCRQYLGWQRSHPAMQSGVKYLLQPENLPQWSNGRRNVYYWYYATQVLHNMQGPEWEQWNTAIRDEIVKNQLKGAGTLGGSWHPTQPTGDPDENADKGGRLYITALCVLILETYYRHMPLYGAAPAK